MTVWAYPRCYVVDVHDGDTIMVDIDLGQDMWIRRRSVRLIGIAARELREPGGKEARDFLASLLPTGTLVEIESQGWDKFAGRIDGTVFITPMQVVNNEMLRAGYAVPWDGRGSQPKPPWPLAPKT
jgi:endonuclease YncB( thermonuclease family)